MIFNMVNAQATGGGGGTVTTTLPTFTFTGQYELIDEGISGGKQNWNLRLLTSGTLRFSDLGGAETLDLFLCGAGGAGCRGGTDGSQSKGWGGSGGCGGKTVTERSRQIMAGVDYEIVIGDGGVGNNQYKNGEKGGSTTGFGLTAEGGDGGIMARGRDNFGGSGGALPAKTTAWDHLGIGGDGGYDGGDGGQGEVTAYGSFGQGVSTREYREPTGRMYGCGGSASGGVLNSSVYGYAGTVYSVEGDTTVYAGRGANRGTKAKSAGANTGGGGGGADYNAAKGTETAGSGGSGIVCCRNARAQAAA